MFTIVCLTAIGLLIGYQALLLTICLIPSLRKKYLESPFTAKGYLFPEATKAARYYKSSKRYDHITLGV
jgi:hypothetical protein